MNPFRYHGAGWVLLTEIFRNRSCIRDIVVVTILINVLAVATSFLVMQVFDQVVPALSYSIIFTFAVGMTVVIVLDWVIRATRTRVLDSVSWDVNNSVPQKVFDHILHMRLKFWSRSLSQLVAQSSGHDSVRQLFSSGVILALIDMPFALIFIAFIGVIGGPLSLIYLGFVPLAVLLGYSTQARLRSLAREQLIHSNEFQEFLVEPVQGLESISSSNRAWRFNDQLNEISKTIDHYNIQNKALSNITPASTGSLSNVAYVAAIIIGVPQIEDGNLTMGGLIACSILGGRVIALIAQSVQHLVQWHTVIQSLQVVDQELQLDTECVPEQYLLIPEKAPKHIGLNSVSFSYPNSLSKQLEIEALHFEAGDRVLLLGSPGSGKSTLLKILAGLYRPSEGRVRMGAVDLWEINPNTITEVIAYLPQNIHLFKGTLRSNLTLSRTASDNQLQQTCDALNISQTEAGSWQGLNLEISEGGEGLPDEQKQLIGLGRFLLNRPSIWLLDEPSTSLGNQAKLTAISVLNQQIQTEDIVIMSSDELFSDVKQANRVIVMHEGRIIKDGRPEQVLP